MEQPLVRSLVDVWERSRELYADRNALGTKHADGQWGWLKYRELAGLVDACRGGFASLGVQPGDRIAIVSDNRVEWVVACYATYGCEAELVPMYQAQLEKEWEHILSDSGAAIVLAAGTTFDVITRLRDRLPGVRAIVGLDLPPDDPQSFHALLLRGEERPFPTRHPSPDSIAGFFYTSGTTGMPKGVVLTHWNLTSNLLAIREVFPLDPGEISLSFLPWAHALGQVCELHYGLSQGMSVAINDEIPNLLENLKEVKPTILVAVPRVFNRIHRTVTQQIATKPKLIQKMFADGLQVSSMHRRGEKSSFLREMALKVDDRLIFSKIRQRFGGRLKMVISGSASLNVEVAELVDALGIDVYEGYGLTETSPVVTCNTRTKRKIGSVGQVLPGVRVEIDTSKSKVPNEGEIIVYGPNVMKGYHNRPEETAATLTPDGGLRTGDLGYMDSEGFLYITGRIKEQYKLETGKYVMPAPVEEQLKLSPYLANVMIYGDGRPYNVAIVVPDRAALDEWARREEIQLDDPARDPRVHALLLRELHAHGELRSYEVPRRLLVVTQDFATENGLLTPTLKLKRSEVLERYRADLEALYAAEEDVRVGAAL